MRYAICEYTMGRVNTICDTRIRYGPCEYDMQYANRLRAMSNCKVAFSATICKPCCLMAACHLAALAWPFSVPYLPITTLSSSVYCKNFHYKVCCKDALTWNLANTSNNSYWIADIEIRDGLKKSASGRGISAKCLFSRTSQKCSIKSSTLSLTNSLDRFRP